MARVELIMPKMGESIMEATILNWVKNVGDTVELDETILEIATDKVDSEIPSPVEGKITEILFQKDDVVEIGKVIAIIETDASAPAPAPSPATAPPAASTPEAPKETPSAIVEQPKPIEHKAPATNAVKNSDRFYSPLVKNMAKKEGISSEELETIPGSGSGNRVTKKDMLHYIQNRDSQSTVSHAQPALTASNSSNTVAKTPPAPSTTPAVSTEGNVEIIEMDRMRKMIANHMVMSKHTSPHVTSFVEVDVTNIVNWRNSIKADFQKKYGQKITFTPIFMDAVVKGIRDFPMVNVSVNGDNIIKKNDINIGMATALPSGNLIVPVIKNADRLNLVGLTESVNDLAARARKNSLKPDEVQGGTFTLTNVGTFGNVMGTPIINQPQVAILAVGAIRKKPAVIETEMGDLIGIRQMMFMSLSYDHRVVDGFLGGSFLRRVGDYLEAFDPNTSL